MCLIPNSSQVDISINRHCNEEGRDYDYGYFVVVSSEQREFRNGWEGSVAF
jgi:hypothetical protein